MGRKKGAINKHKKEKPHKEKKSKGRPKGSMKQKQKQHQIVNVNINTGDEGNKKRDLKDYIPSIPNVIFNPSLSIPQGYPNVKQETNPPFYDMNGLLPDYNTNQESLIKIIKDAIRPPQPIEPMQPPIRPPQPVEPVQPPIRPPVRPPIRPPKPVEPVQPPLVQPNPQADQSHPIYTDKEIEYIYEQYNHPDSTHHKQQIEKV